MDPEHAPTTFAVDDRRRYTLAYSFDDLLDLVVDDVARRTPFERVVAVAGLPGYLVGRGRGVPRGEIEAFVGALAKQEGGGVGLDTIAASADPPLERLTSFHSPALIPAVTPEDNFLAAVAVEADPQHPELAAVREILRSAAAALFRGAESHALRSKVASLESQQLRVRLALDALPDPVLVMDPDARILLANRRAEHLLVTAVEDSPGRRHAVETNNLFFSAFRARALLQRDHRDVTRELLLVDPTDGSDLLFEVFVQPFHLSESSPESSIFVLRDITDLKQATHELEVQVSHSLAARHEARRESERLNVIIENAGAPIFVTDRQTNVVLMNKEAEHLLESAPAAGSSDPVPDVRANDTRLSGFINEFLLQPGARREGRLTLVDPDRAAEFPALAVSTKILGKHDEPMGVVTVLHDLTQEVENQHLAQELQSLNAQLEERVAGAISELAKRNRQLEEQRTELERTSRMKSEFLATMSHELRTPINAILGYNSLLRDGLFGQMSDPQVDALRRMRRAAEHLLTLINDILDLSRVEAGKIQVAADEFDLPSFLDELSETVRPMAAQRSLAYQLDVDDGIGTMTTDPTRLRQVLLNLLSNAVKFTDEGSITLRCGVGDAPDRIRLEVVDTGVGIAPEDLGSIFEEFTQADQSSTRKHGGVGLGLAISRKLILIMGGTLEVSSEVGIGTTFSVDLPRVFADPPEQAGLELGSPVDASVRGD